MQPQRPLTLASIDWDTQGFSPAAAAQNTDTDNSANVKHAYIKGDQRHDCWNHFKLLVTSLDSLLGGVRGEEGRGVESDSASVYILRVKHSIHFLKSKHDGSTERFANNCTIKWSSVTGI